MIGKAAGSAGPYARLFVSTVTFKKHTGCTFFQFREFLTSLRPQPITSHEPRAHLGSLVVNEEGRRLVIPNAGMLLLHM